MPSPPAASLTPAPARGAAPLPPAVTARLNAAINKALETEKVRDALAKLGVDPGGGTPDEFGVTLHSEIARWGKIVQEAAIKIQQ